MSIFLDKFAAPLNRFSTGSYDIVVFFIITIQLDIVTRYDIYIYIFSNCKYYMYDKPVMAIQHTLL